MVEDEPGHFFGNVMLKLMANRTEDSTHDWNMVLYGQDFDLSPESLLKLQNEGVPDEVLAAMMEASSD